MKYLDSIVFAFLVFALIVLFAGEPDLHDVLIMRLMPVTP